MYLNHFGLKGLPFQFTPSPASFFAGPAHREGFAALEWGLLQEPSGFTLLIGETGMGKTTLLCALLERYRNHIRAVHITNPRLSSDEILQLIVNRVGAAPAGSSKLELIEAFERFLHGLGRGERVAIIVDEAQALSDDALEELRLLSNCGGVEEKQLCFILAGQPELLRRLAARSMRQFDERIGARAILAPLDDGEAHDYVEYRLAAQGGDVGRIFNRRALRYLIANSGGIPRRINVLCHNALVCAYSSGVRKVNVQMARSVVKEREDFLAAAKTDGNADGSRAPLRAVGKGVRFRASLVAIGTAVAAAVAIYLWSPARRSVGPPVGITIPSAATTAAHARLALARSQDQPAPSIRIAAVDTQTAHIKTKPAAPPVHAHRLPASPAAIAPPLATHIDQTGASTEGAWGVEAPRPAAMGGRHLKRVTVVSGDTLGELAKRYLGSEEQLGRLVAVNPQFDDINRIYPGDIVFIPGVGRTAQGRETSWASITKR